MALPPVWYVLLIGTTLAASPWILRGARSADTRRFAMLVLGGVALYETGLVLLFYAKLLCWVFVTLGVVTAATAGNRTRPWLGAATIGPPALAAGLAFQFLPSFADFFLYFAIGIPLLLGAAFALALAPWLRWRADAPMMLFAASLLLFAAFTPASAFAFTFLVHYEIFHLPALVGLLSGLAWFTRHGAERAGTARDAALARRTRGDRAAQAARLVPVAGLLVASGSALAFPVFLEAPLAAAVTWAGAAVLLAALIGTLIATFLRGAHVPVLIVTAALGGIGASLLGARAGAEAFQSFGGGPAPESLLFYVAGIAIALMGLGGALGLSALRAALAVRQRAPALQRIRNPMIVEATDAVPHVAQLDEFRTRLKRAHAPAGVLHAHAPLHPLDGLPPPVAAWLAAQHDGPRVHLAVREGTETFYIPDLEAVADA